MKLFFTILVSVIFLAGCKNAKVTSQTSEIADQTDLPFTFEKITTLDKKYTETSGLEYHNGEIITHNDSGDLPRIYFLDTLGNGIRQTQFNKMKAIDWEDISRDEKYLYIADIGNNFGDRKDLTLYKTSIKTLEDEDAAVQKIHIDYPDQTDFRRNEQRHPYDAESIVSVGDYLYVFSKDWKELSTVVYRINKNNSEQQAMRITSHAIRGLVTGATFDHQDTVVLCGYSSNLIPFVVKVSVGNENFAFDEKHELPIKNGAQVEAITYAYTRNDGKQVYYLSSEAAAIQLGEDEAQSNAELYKMVW